MQANVEERFRVLLRTKVSWRAEFSTAEVRGVLDNEIKEKKGNKSTNQHEAAASSSREAGDTQQEREVEGSEAKGS